jgi:hypothetical protein
MGLMEDTHRHDVKCTCKGRHVIQVTARIQRGGVTVAERTYRTECPCRRFHPAPVKELHE